MTKDPYNRFIDKLYPGNSLVVIYTEKGERVKIFMKDLLFSQKCKGDLISNRLIGDNPTIDEQVEILNRLKKTNIHYEMNEEQKPIDYIGGGC